MSTTPPATPAPGWYPDPYDATTLRYWDGSTWTEHRAPRTPPAGAVGGAPYGAYAAGRPPLADFGARLVGALIDGVVVTIPLALLMAIPFLLLIRASAGSLGALNGSGPGTAEASFLAVVILFFVGMALFILVPVLYHVGFEGGRQGQTIGKWAMNVRVVDAATAGRVAPSKAFIRILVRSFASGAVFYLGFLWMLWDDQNRTWHDMAADTRVVVTDTRVPFGQFLRSFSLRGGNRA